jgi:hypothetical protein
VTESTILVTMRSMRLRLPAPRPNAPILAMAAVVIVVALIIVMAALQTGCTGCRVARDPGATQQRTEALRQPGTLPKSVSSEPLMCPTIGASGSSAAAQAPGAHKVILSWTASKPADSRHAAAVGYCIYRGITHNDPSPQLVNSVPFPGTSCADDFVENGKKYYYVVRAIASNRVTSIVSNEAPAPIPTGAQTNRSASAASADLCRQPGSRK